MNIPLPVEIEQRLARDDVRLHLAIGLFVSDEVTLGQAAAVANLPQPAFLQELGKRKIPLHYGIAEAEADIATVDRIAVVQR